MADFHVENLITTVSAVASAGLGAFTISAASSGSQTFGASHDGKTFSVRATEGTKWESAVGCPYTHSGTSLGRGTRTGSSNGGAAETFTSAVVITVTPSADLGNRTEAAALFHVAGTDASTTMVVNSLYVVDMSAWATADRTYTLPATAAAGDRVGIMITAGDASHELLITAASGDTLNGVAGGTEWSRLFIAGEVVIMRCVAANSTWIVEYDGRIPQKCLLRLSTSVTTNLAVTWTVPTAASGAWTADIDVGSIAGISTSRITPRRTGRYAVSAGGITNSVMGADKEFGVGLWKNGTSSGGGTLVVNQTVACGPAAYGSTVFINPTVPLVTDDYLVYHFFTTTANDGLLSVASPRLNSSFAIAEVLP